MTHVALTFVNRRKERLPNRDSNSQPLDWQPASDVWRFLSAAFNSILTTSLVQPFRGTNPGHLVLQHWQIIRATGSIWSDTSRAPVAQSVATPAVNPGVVCSANFLSTCVIRLPPMGLVYVEKQPVAWEDCCVENWCGKTRKCMIRWTGRRDITQKLLKTALNPKQSMIWHCK